MVDIHAHARHPGGFGAAGPCPVCGRPGRRAGGSCGCRPSRRPADSCRQRPARAARPYIGDGGAGEPNPERRVEGVAVSPGRGQPPYCGLGGPLPGEEHRIEADRGGRRAGQARGRARRPSPTETWPRPGPCTRPRRGRRVAVVVVAADGWRTPHGSRGVRYLGETFQQARGPRQAAPALVRRQTRPPCMSQFPGRHARPARLARPACPARQTVTSRTSAGFRDSWGEDFALLDDQHCPVLAEDPAFSLHRDGDAQGDVSHKPE